MSETLDIEINKVNCCIINMVDRDNLVKEIDGRCAILYINDIEGKDRH